MTELRGDREAVRGRRVEVKLVEAEALRVGPDEVLIVRLPQNMPVVDDENPQALIDGLMEALVAVGLEGRCLVMCLDAELAVVPKSE